MNSRPRIAIVGMGCRLPGAHGLGSLWELLAQKGQRFAKLPSERFAQAVFAADLPRGPERAFDRAAALDDFQLDWRALKLPPIMAERLHRMERAAIATMGEALADAGISSENGFGGRAQIFIAASTLGPDPLTDHGRRIRRFELAAPVGDALELHLPSQKAAIDEIIERLFNLAAPPIDPDSMQTSASLTAGRIANIFDLRGGHLAIDAGMASSLAALDRAVTALATGACDVATVCALSPLLTPSALLVYAHRGWLSASEPRPFDPSADGTLLGEGCAAVVLVRHEEAAGRRVYATVDGIGRVVVPRRGEGLAECTAQAVREALSQAGVSASEVELVESRACGVSENDLAEGRGLVAGYGGERTAPVAASSTVANLGFLQAASGMVALVKAALCLWRQSWPAQAGAGEPAGDGPRVVGQAQEWKGPRTVGVSDAGLGPLVYHALLSGGQAPRLQRPAPPRRQEPIAIVGAGCLVPQADNVETFWKNVLGRVDAIGDLPRSRWDIDKLVGSSPDAGAVLRTRLAGVIRLPPAHEANRFGIPSSVLRQIDPAAFLSLLVAEQALADARYRPGAWDPERVAVILGQLPLRVMEMEVEKRVLFADHLQLVADAMREAEVPEPDVQAVVSEARFIFDRDTVPLSAASFNALTGLTSPASVAAAHGFRGTVLSVDAACASALAAVHLAAEDLMTGAADVALAGGVAYNLLPEYYITLSMLGALSTRGVPAFHAESTGFVPAEGAGMVVLKRLSDAEKARDRIYAVIRGIGLSSDGKGLSVYAPNTQGQQRAIRHALEAAGVEPGSVDLLEAHGAGTKIGDKTEMESYAAVYAARDPGLPLAIGTVKSQIGHLSSAAGAIGLIKVALALREKVLPPTLSTGEPDPDLPFGKVPLELSTESRQWVTPPGRMRRAAVSAIGLGGINFHYVLEEYAPPEAAERRARASAPARLPARGTWADRFVVELAPVALPDRAPLFPLRGRHALIVADRGGRFRALAEALRRREARVSVLEAGTPGAGAPHPDPLPFGEGDKVKAYWGAAVADAEAREGPVQLVLDLSAFGEEPKLVSDGAAALAPALREHTARTFAVLRAVYDRLGSAPERGAGWVAVTSLGGDLGLTGCDRGNILGASLAGLAKGLKQELPHTVCKVIDFDPLAPPEEMAEAVLREVEDGNDRMEVGYAGRRFGMNLRRANFDESVPVLRPLAAGDVFIFSGGGRGVVFECACALARLGARAVVTGRTPLPDPALPWLSLDEESWEAYRKEELVRRRAADPSLTPARFNRDFQALVQQRELHRNLARARLHGLPLEYRVCDITDPRSVRALVEEVRRAHGKIDGVAHGAMVEWSTSLPRKTPEMIERTMATKVLGMVNLIEATREDGLKVFLSFGSGAGRFGNRGQTDYSAANALMAALLAAHARRMKAHCVTIDWTAWESVGAAVANPDIASLVKATGVTSIKPEEGTYWFLSELALGRGNEVVIFEEKMLHQWPFLGTQPEGTGERSVAFDDRGKLLVPGQWPMVDHLVESAPGRVKFERRLDVARDRFLSQHTLHGTPIVPGTFGCEILAEAAALACPGWEVATASNIQIRAPVKLYRDEPLIIRAYARVVEERDDLCVVEAGTGSNLFVRGKALQQDRVHHTGRFEMRRQGTAPARKLEIPEREGAVRARSFFHMAKDPVGLGPLFCRAEWIQLGENEVTGTVRAPRQRDILATTAYPYFRVDPLLMDASFQVAANWDGYRNGFVSIPLAIGRIALWRRRAPSETARVKAQVAQVVDPDVFYNIVVAGEGGDVLLEVEGLHLRRIARIENLGES